MALILELSPGGEASGCTLVTKNKETKKMRVLGRLCTKESDQRSGFWGKVIV